MLALLVRAMPGRSQRRRVQRGLTRYQRPGQNLVRVAMRPELEDWLELGQIAAHLGVSRCLAFMLLIRSLRTRELSPRLSHPAAVVLWRRAGVLWRERIPLLALQLGGKEGDEVPDGHIPGKPG